MSKCRASRVVNTAAYSIADALLATTAANGTAEAINKKKSTEAAAPYREDLQQLWTADGPVSEPLRRGAFSLRFPMLDSNRLTPV